MTNSTPCQSNPDDFFIMRDGRQYPDDAMTEDEQREALQRRRRAKDSCFTECPVRTQCLDLALRDQPSHGTWGGYTEEELRKLYNEIARRQGRA